MTTRGGTQEQHIKPGEAGGRATADAHDSDFYKEIGQQGGKGDGTHGSDFYRKIGRRGGTQSQKSTGGNGGVRSENEDVDWDEEGSSSASGAHHTAAGFHESAAYHHRQAADAHSQGRHDEGQDQARTAYAHSRNAHDHSVEAGRRSHPRGKNNADSSSSEGGRQSNKNN